MSDENNQEALYEAYEYITAIKEKLESDNRFFTDKRFLKYLETIFRESEVNISEDNIFYRARSYDRNKIDKSKIGTEFEGYDKEESFVNISSKWPTYGRMNPQGISALYVATDINTAITELHPYHEQIFSVATIRVKNELKIANLSVGASAISDDFIRNLTVLVKDWISNGNTEKDYVFPQYIASYCKHMGYDGIGYRSKYNTRANVCKGTGINYTIFNYDKCEVTGSKLYEINNIEVKINKKFKNFGR
jgi:hypothetical protein